MEKSLPSKDFRLFLQEELVRRCRANPSYSLRAFARTLDISPSALSAILRGIRPITSKMKLRLGLILGLTTIDLQLYSTSEKAQKTFQSNRGLKSQDFYQLNLDHLAIISDWYHYAILELTRINGFVSDAGWIAKILGITKSECSIAVERLMRVGFLKDENGVWTDSSPNNGNITNFTEKQTSSANKKFQKEIMEKSIDALLNVDVNKRNHTAMTMAINIQDFERALQMIKLFRREFTFEMETSAEKTHVYNLQIGFYPVSHDPKESV
jgi:uncharacterized protein (TIGR02147 family)